jgi:hypothetical protein
MALPAQADARALGDDFVEAAERALTAAVRLYAAKTESDKPPAQPITPSSVTPTDIVVTVSDMIKSAGLNLWDVSMWFNRTKR